MTDADEPVVVFSGDTIEADLVKGLLEQAGIEAFLYNERSPRTAALSDYIQVVVAQRDLAEAAALVQALSEDIGAAPS